MKILRGLFRIVVGLLITLYACFLLVSSLPFMQRRMAAEAETALCNLFGTKVSIASISISMFGYAQIDSLLIEDRMGYPMLFATRVSAKMSVSELLYDDKVHLEHAQLYGLKCVLRQEKADSAWNFQFVVDALQGDDSQGNDPITIQANSIMVRRGHATVDRVFCPIKEEGFDPNHIVLSHITLNAVIDRIHGNDDVAVSVNRLALAEQSGLRIKSFDVSFSKNGDIMRLSPCVLHLPGSTVDLQAATDGNEWHVRTNGFYLDPNDLAPVDGRLEGKGGVSLSLVAQGDTSACRIDTCIVRHDAFRLQTEADVRFTPLHVATANTMLEADVPALVQELSDGFKLPSFCGSDYKLGFQGSMVYSDAAASLAGSLLSPHGTMAVDARLKDGDMFDASLSTTEFDLSAFSRQLGIVAMEASSSGSIKRKKVQLSASIPHIDIDGYTYHDATVDAVFDDSVQAALSIADHNLQAQLQATVHPDMRRVQAMADIQHISTSIFDREAVEKPTTYSGRLNADVAFAANLAHSTGRIELSDVTRNGSVLTKNLVVTADKDSLQHLDITSPFMMAHITSSDIQSLVRNRADSALVATVRVWDEAPIDSLLDIQLSLLDTLRIDADGSKGPLMLQLGFDNMLKEHEIHLGAIATLDKDSLGVDITLQSPYDSNAEAGRVVASVLLSDTAGIEDCRAKVYNLNVGYVMNLVNFHSVEFNGWASGDVEVQQLKGDPFINGLLDIRSLTLNSADMGSLDLHITFDTSNGKLGLDGLITDPLNAHMSHAYGYVIPGHRPTSGMDLYVDTKRINAAFINDFTEGIFENVQGRASGHARVYGKFSQIDLYGDLRIDTLSLHVPIIGTGFTSVGDSVRLRPGLFDFPSVHISDGRGGTGLVSGQLHHNHFDDITYSFDIDADRLLGYYSEDFDDMPFYATAVATGHVSINGSPGRLNANLQCRPDHGTMLVYNTSGSSVTSNSFITYGSLSADTVGHSDAAIVLPLHEANTGTDINIGFDLDIDDRSHLRIITDAISGDAINLYGRGHIMAHYYNKGSFRMFGTYEVDRGDYNLSIQNIIHKKFDFRSGGTLAFGGPPLQGTLNLQAVYPVHNVSLGDLSSRATFANAGVRVDCIMNLTGNCEAPRVTFDFDLPNVNEDEKRMVRSLISTDEERNMQVLYLLGIGRFYSYDYSGSASGGQGNVAMKSLLSSTLSSTINNVIGNAIGNNNWTFGTSIATGDVGWSDMDVEGLVSGRLFNNRLMVNGQFGYRDRTATGSNFIGDFDLQWKLTRSGNMAVKAYSETNDRYFTKSSLTTQGIGLIMKKDFNAMGDMLGRWSLKKETKEKQSK